MASSGKLKCHDGFHLVSRFKIRGTLAVPETMVQQMTYLYIFSLHQNNTWNDLTLLLSQFRCFAWIYRRCQTEFSSVREDCP